MLDKKHSLKREEYKERKLLFLKSLCDKVDLNLDDILANGLDVDNLIKDDKYNTLVLINKNLQIYKNII